MKNMLQLIIAFWNLAKKYAKTYVDTKFAALSGGLHWKGAVNYYADLPANPEEGDCYTVKYMGSSGTTIDGTEYAYGIDADGTAQWIAIGSGEPLHLSIINGVFKITVGSTEPLAAMLVNDTIKITY